MTKRPKSTDFCPYPKHLHNQVPPPRFLRSHLTLRNLGTGVTKLAIAFLFVITIQSMIWGSIEESYQFPHPYIHGSSMYQPLQGVQLRQRYSYFTHERTFKAFILEIELLLRPNWIVTHLDYWIKIDNRTVQTGTNDNLHIGPCVITYQYNLSTLQNQTFQTYLNVSVMNHLRQNFTVDTNTNPNYFYSLDEVIPPEDYEYIYIPFVGITWFIGYTLLGMFIKALFAINLRIFSPEIPNTTSTQTTP